MTRFVEIKDSAGQPTWVNPDQVSVIKTYGGNASTLHCGDYYAGLFPYKAEELVRLFSR